MAIGWRIWPAATGSTVRHQPPMTNRPWVLTEAGRRQHLGEMLNCKKCEEEPSK